MNQILNYEKALSITGGDAELVSELLDLFLEELPKLESQIKQAIDTEDAKGLEYAAHTLKGAAGNIGAEIIWDISLKLEMMGRNKDMVGSQQTLEQLFPEIQKLQREITARQSSTVQN